MKFVSSQFKTIYLNTFQKEFRNKSIIFLLVLTILFIFVINGIFGFITGLLDGTAMPTDGTIGKLPLNLFYNFIESWSVLVAAALGVSIVQSDKESNVITQLLSFPIKRWEYLLARILGGWSIVVLYYLFSITLAQFLFYTSSKVFLGSGQITLAVLNSCLIVLPTIFLSVFYSLFTSKIIAFILTFFTAGIVSWANYSMDGVASSEILQNLSPLTLLAAIVHYLFPRVGVLNGFTNQLLQGKDLSIGLYSMTYLHYFVTAIIFFLFLSFVFKRKDF